jgi:importin subunit beta-1
MFLTWVFFHGCLQEQEEGDSSVINHHFVKQALQPLLELLLQQLLKQEEDQDRDDTLWNVSMAAGTCIGLIAATVGDDIIPDVMAFVQVLKALDLTQYYIHGSCQAF